MNSYVPAAATLNPPREPSDATKQVIQQFAFLRGAFIGSYAQVEFLLADICVKAWPRPQYQHLRSKFPYQADSRVKAANALFESAGPLSKYLAEVDGLFEKLLRYEEFRDFLAHGLMRVEVEGKNKATIQLRMYRPEKIGLKLGMMTMELRQMADASVEIVKFTHQLVVLFRRIYREQNLEYPPEMRDEAVIAAIRNAFARKPA